MKKLLTGNEAIARGAYEAGVRYAAAYPGTPSTEILENITQYEEIKAEWAANEKVALESSIGASIAGARAIASMKHVGLNVASDPLMSFAYTGVTGGLVIVTADEPGQHSSQTEQDNRHFAPFAKIPMLEPSDSQESKDMVKIALEISEEFDTPVLLRTTTRVCHSKSIVDCYDREEVPIIEYKKNKQKYITVPAFAKILRVKVEERIEKLKEYSNNTPLNFIEWNDKKIGVISSGMCFNYAKEVFGESASYLKLGFTYPLPDEMIKEFASQVDKIYIIEENDPIIEERVKMLGFDCHGVDTFPPYGELTPDIIRKSVEGSTKPSLEYDKSMVVPRPPTLCAGCPHRGFFYELRKIIAKKNAVVVGDIGCYTLGMAEPYDGIDFTINMGSAYPAAHGAQSVFNMLEDNKRRVIAMQGDSTFFHTGISGLLSTVFNKGNTINVVLDNRATAMTGHQDNPGTGYTAEKDPTISLDIETFVRACGINNVISVNPNDLEAMRNAFNWALAIEDEPSVIITRWPCALKKFTKEDREEFEGLFSDKYEVEEEVCIGCKRCTKTGCPAIEFKTDINKSYIDYNQCVGCSVCYQVCPTGAIRKVVK
jgi:indolepyruvate ferredoxin oxidoreductase alpha subunit